ncbi:hypothetical protein HQ545_01535 [Candidatus Woesearchaeota archaeon]|nr:hypothetical protein [Candidatus Woesearchaeota archaeon]
MAIDEFISAVFPIQCRGRNKDREKVLDTPVSVQVEFYQRKGDVSNITSDVTCEYNTGGHGQRCKASHPDVDKEGESVFCPYAFDIPYALGEISKEAKDITGRIEKAFNTEIEIGTIVRVFLKDGLMFRLDKDIGTAQVVDVDGPENQQVTSLSGEYESSSSYGSEMHLEFANVDEEDCCFSVYANEIKRFDLDE